MRARWLRGVTLFAMASASVLACTFIVDGQFKDFSGTCQIQGIADNVCGRCVTRNKCQPKIDALCNKSRVTSDISACVQNPAPGRNWNCSGLISDAALNASNITPAENDLNHCVAGCTSECMTCTSIDAGTGTCGTCIMSNCAPLLNGNDGCCDDTTVIEGIGKCTAAINPSCGAFRDIVQQIVDDVDAAHHKDGGSDAEPVFRSCKDYSAAEFAQCVVSHCDSDCPK